MRERTILRNLGGMARSLWIFFGIGIGWMAVAALDGAVRGVAPRAFDVTILDGGLETRATARAFELTKEFFDRAGIVLGPHDIVLPTLETRLVPGATIMIERATPVTLIEGVTRKAFYTRARTVGKAVAEGGVMLRGFDFTRPGLDAMVTSNQTIRVVRVDEREIREEREIAPRQVLKSDPTIAHGEQVIIRKGIPGKETLVWRLRYQDGREASRTLVERRTIIRPKTEIAAFGTKIETLPYREGLASWYRFKSGNFAASTMHPRGTKLLVTNLFNGKRVTVTVNDFGPTIPGRIIDLDAVAFAALAPLGSGVIPVRVEQIL